MSVITFVVYTLAWSAASWFMTRERPAAPKKYHSAPIDITTPEERARGESTFEIARERTFGITRTGFFILVALGYFVLAVILLIAFIKSRSSAS
jgi:hypothetical protein